MTEEGSSWGKVQAIAARLKQVDIEHLRRGWLLVPSSWLHEAVQALAARQEKVESARLELYEGHAILELTLRMRVRATVRSRVRLDEFVLSASQGVATLVFDDAPDIAVEMQGLFGRFWGRTVERGIERLFESGQAQHRLQAEQEVWELQWPRLTVHLDRIEAIGRLREMQFAGVGLLDLVAFGPANVEPDGIHIRVRPTGLGQMLRAGGRLLGRLVNHRRGD